MTLPAPDQWQVDLTGILLGGPKLNDAAAQAFAEVEAERKADFGRATNLEAAATSETN